MIEKWAMQIKNKSEKRTLHRLSVSGGAFLVWAMSKGSSPSEEAASSPNSVESRTLEPDSISKWWRPDNDVGSKPLVEEEEPRDVMALLPWSPCPYVVVSVRYMSQEIWHSAPYSCFMRSPHTSRELKFTVWNDVVRVLFFFWPWAAGLGGGLICFDLLKIAQNNDMKLTRSRSNW